MKRILLSAFLGMTCYVLSSSSQFTFDYSSEKMTSLQKKLATNQVLIYYELDANSTFLSMTLLRKQQREAHKIPLPPNFKKEVLELYKMLQNFSLVQKSKRVVFIQKSHQFYELLFRPIENHLQKGEDIIVVGQGILQYLPFEILLSSPTNKEFHTLDFLVKKHAISYYFKPEHFLQSKTSSSNHFSKNLLGFAPVFQVETSEANKLSSRNLASGNDNSITFFDDIPPLPYSEQEIKTIPEVLPVSPVLLLHQQAQKDVLKQKLQQNFQYVHIASHSFANFENKNQSGILCAGGPNECDPVYEVLYTKEIEELKIQTDLVVLSSCQSGVGQLDSEGVQGIHRSFYKAGAQNVVFSLWKVNDRICQRFMTVFYTEIAKGVNYSNALRTAKLDLLQNEDTASPNIWGAFLMIGQ